MTRIAHAALLACAIALAAFLRFDALGLPSYWLDEILGQIVMRNATAMPLWKWLAGFHAQHGPLYYATQLLASFVSDSESAGRFFAALFGVVTIPVVWLAARRAVDDSTAIATAVLLAVSPLHVYYSREARAYALVVLLATLLLLAILVRAKPLAIAVLLLLLYTSMAAAPAVAAAAVAALAAAQLQTDARARADQRFIGVAALFTLPLFALLYRGGTGAVEEAAFSGISFDRLVRALGVTAVDAPERGRAAYVIFALAVIGLVALARRNRPAAVVISAMAVLPIAVSLAALRATNHFFAVRYLIPALAAYLLLAGTGIAWIASVARGMRVPVAVVAAVAIAWQCWPAARHESFRKLDWRTIAATLTRYARPGDVVIAAEPWSSASLGYYLARQPHAPRLVLVPYVDVADIVVRTHPGSWLVSSGFSTDTRVRQWMCRYPVVLASGLEEFRMHYAGDFFRDRGGIAEQRAMAGAMGNAVRLVPSEFGEGWGNVEGDYRWAVGTRATVSLPRFGKRDRVVRIQVLPYRPPQSIRIRVNGALAATIDPPGGWSEQSALVPARFWRDGINEIAFEFAHAIAPSSLGESDDQRELAAMFEWIAIEDRGATPTNAPPVRPVRIASVLLNAPRERTAEPAPPQLLARLGLDPTMKADAPAAALSIAYGSECEDPRAFLRRVFAVLLERHPGPEEERILLAERSRLRMVRSIIKGSEFRSRIR